MVDISALVMSSLGRAPWGWSLLLVVLIALIKAWPVLQLQVIEANAKMRGERRDDLHDCQERLDKMESRFNEVMAHVHQLDLKLVGTVAAYRILHDDMAANDPDNSALAQARTVFRTTWDDPLMKLGVPTSS